MAGALASELDSSCRELEDVAGLWRASWTPNRRLIDRPCCRRMFHGEDSMMVRWWPTNEEDLMYKMRWSHMSRAE